MKLVFDIGGTTTRIGVSSEGSRLDQIETYQTPQSYKDGLLLMKTVADKLSGNQPIKEVAGGIAGGLNEEKTSLLHGGNISDWVDKPLTQDLSNLFDAEKVVLENDTAAGALGESHFGAGRSYNSMIYIAVGTGVGGAWIIDKRLVKAPYSFEPGHQIIDLHSNKTWQDFISGKAIELSFDQPASEVSSEELWQEIAEPFLAGLQNTLLHWPSEVIILGGGVVLGHNLPINELRQALQSRLPIEGRAPHVQQNELGDYSTLYGCLYLLK